MATPECPHVTITLVGEQLECAECHDHDMVLKISNQQLAQLLHLVDGIIDSLELAGMNDTAMSVRQQASRLVVNRQLTWRP